MVNTKTQAAWRTLRKIGKLIRRHRLLGIAAELLHRVQSQPVLIGIDIKNRKASGKFTGQALGACEIPVTKLKLLTKISIIGNIDFCQCLGFRIQIVVHSLRRITT